MGGRFFILLTGVCSIAISGPLHAADTCDRKRSCDANRRRPTVPSGVKSWLRRSGVKKACNAFRLRFRWLAGEAITDRAITTQSDLQTVVPGLTVRASADSNQLNYAIRGPVARCLQRHAAWRASLRERGPGRRRAVLRRFTILARSRSSKGPQGTLFGRNATGGAVLFLDRQAHPTGSRVMRWPAPVITIRSTWKVRSTSRFPRTCSCYALRVCTITARGFSATCILSAIARGRCFPVANDPAPGSIRSESQS